MFKKEFAPHLNWFIYFNIFVDLGYIGICKDFTAKNIFIPHKKPYKTKNNQNPKLSEQQKSENKEVSRKRIVVENSIGGMKRFRCLVNRFRNHIPFVKDLTILLAAGIWNLNVINRE